MRRLNGRRKTGVRISKMPCEGDEELRAEVETLLSPGRFAARPAGVGGLFAFDRRPYANHNLDHTRLRRRCAEVHEVNVSEPSIAQKVGFLGSPGIRVNALDVEPEATRACAYATMCRTDAVNGRRRRIAVTRDVAASDAKRIPV